MSVTNEETVLGKEESVSLRLDQLGQRSLTTENLILIVCAGTEATGTAEGYYILFLHFRCLTVEEDDQKF